MDNSKLIVAALNKTNPELSQKIDGSNSWAQAIAMRGARVKLYRAYDEGEHRSCLTDQMRALLHLKQGPENITDFADNYCAIVNDKMAGRVSVGEVSTGDETTDENWLEPMLAKQDFQAAEGMWWRGAICDGDSYVMVDPLTLQWSSEPAFDGFSGMIAVYNQMTRKPIWACKVWAESDTKDQDDEGGGVKKTMHLVVYQPDKISYWQGQDGAAEVMEMKQGDGQSIKVWPPELKGALPFVSFANERNNYTRYGNSEIRKAIPLQDVLNRTIHSMVMASEFAAFPVNYSIGMEITSGGVVPGGIINLVLKDTQGNAVSSFSPDQIAFIAACKVGQFAPADIAQYTNQVITIVKEISQATQTPIYGITADGALSGEALKQLEIGLIGKVKRFQRQNTDALKELIMLTAKMERVYNPGLGTPEIDNIDITWTSPELLDNNVLITNLIAMERDAPDLWAPDFYRQKIGQLMGMSKEDIADEGVKAEAFKQEKLDNMALLQPPSMFGQGGDGTNAQDGAKADETDMQDKKGAPANQSKDMPVKK